MKIFIILSTLVVVISAVPLVDLFKEEWELFKIQFNKTYQSQAEETFRMKIYMNNMFKILKHNQRYKKNKVSYSLKMNEFGDMLHHEFVAERNGYKRNSARLQTDDKAVTYIAPFNVTVPDTVDWRKKGAVTDVKDQGGCGSCWAFSSTGALEGQLFRKTGKLVSLSEQNLIDCSRNYGNQGCEGGWVTASFKYVQDNRGIDTENYYPYEGQNDYCRYDAQWSGASDNGYVYLPEGNENKLKIAVATVGPISVAIDASHESFQFYHDGVYYEKYCSSTNLNHAVLVVGYGTSKGMDYWLVKNSWGTRWGDSGYIKIARNMENNCGIASYATYPLM